MVTRISLVLALVVVVIIQKQGLVGGADLQVTGLNFSNHSMNATADRTPTSTAITEKNQKNSDNSFRSEVYKMHANGLMLLHAQRTRSGIEAKKSQLNNKLVNSGINYHIRKKNNDTVNAVQENERHLEAKLGDLPQVRQRRAYNGLIKNNSQVVKNYENVSCAHSSTYNATNNVKCHHRRHHVGRRKHHRHRHARRKHHWRSIVQGEDVSGEEVKKTRIYPEKVRGPETSGEHHDDVDDITKGILLGKRQIEYVVTSDATLKRTRLKRALDLMGADFDENPLYDSQQAQTVTVDQILQKEIGDIPEIASLQNNGDKDSSTQLRNSRVKLFYDLQEPSSDAFESVLGISKIPKIEDDLLIGSDTSIPNIPAVDSIRPDEDESNTEEGRDTNTERRAENSDGIETGDRRTSVSKDEFVDDDVEDSIETIKGVTPPTPIPDLTDISTISNIPLITDIPTLRPIPVPTTTGSSKVKKLPHVESIEERNSTTIQFRK